MKNRNKSGYLFIGLLFICVLSCTEQDQEIDSMEASEASYNPYHVSIDDANKIACSFIDEIEAIKAENGEIVTRSTSSRTIGRVDVVKSEKMTITTRSSLAGVFPDTLLYMINYEGEKGFAVVGADKRLNQVYAISDEGHFNLADTAYNKGLAFFWDNVILSIESNIGKENEAIVRSQLEDWDIKTEIYDKWRGGVTPTLWGQNEPYNAYCFTTSGELAKAGCGAVAVAQAMAAFGWPSSFENNRFTWSSMLKTNPPNYGLPTPRDKVAYLIAAIGRRAYLNMDYGVITSSSNLSDVPRTFQAFEYHKPTLATFNSTTLRESFLTAMNNLFMTHPVIVRGGR